MSAPMIGTRAERPGVSSMRAQKGVVYFATDTKEYSIFDGSTWTTYEPELSAVVQLTNAQVKLLRATPVELVAAPGAGKYLILERVALVADTSVAWTETADNLVVEYADGTDLLTVETTGFIDQVTAQARHQAMAEAVLTPIVNSGIQIKNDGDGEFGGGVAGATLSVRTWYRVASAVAFS